MDIKKNIKKIVSIVLSIACFCVTTIQAVDWDNYTSFQEVRNLKVLDDTLYVTTSGGLIQLASSNDNPISYKKLDGLGTNDISDILKDANGDKWITGFGRLIKWSGNLFEQFLFFDNINNNLFQLHKLVDDADNLWVGSSLGLVLFSKVNDGGQIEDSYTLFGDLNPNTSVNDLKIENNMIWLATSDGIAYADKSNIALLKSPSNWSTISTRNFPILDNNEFVSIQFVDTSIYALNRTGLYKIDIDQFDSATVTEISLPSTTEHQNMVLRNDTLIVLSENFGNGYGIRVYNGNYISIDVYGVLKPSAEILFDSFRWVGSQSKGLFQFENSTSTAFELGGLPDNNVSDIAVDSKGRMYAGFSNKAFAVSDGAEWLNLNFTVGQDATVAMTDSLDRVWMGTWGNGVWVSDNGTLKNYDETNSSLRGNSDNPPVGLSYVYVTGMDTDGRYVYLTSYRAVNNYPIAIGDMNNLDSPAGWDSIGINNGLSNNFLTSLDYDKNKVAVGTESDGVYECFVGENPFLTQKTTRHLTKENSLLISNSVRDVAYAPDGELWVATNFGLSRYDLGIDFFRDILLPEELSSDVTALQFDGRGNLWIGTQDGLALRNPVDGSFEVFTTFNSGLISDFIKDLTFDPYTGNIFVATDKGISMIASLTGKPVFEISDVLAFPNPFIINSESDKLNFNYGIDAQVSIFNAMGEHIITMSVNKEWDGRNDKGKEVASGPYFFIVKNENGDIGKGKILLVRN